MFDGSSDDLQYLKIHPYHLSKKNQRYEISKDWCILSL